MNKALMTNYSKFQMVTTKDFGRSNLNNKQGCKRSWKTRKELRKSWRPPSKHAKVNELII